MCMHRLLLHSPTTSPSALQALDKSFVSDVCKAPVSQQEMDQSVLDRIIAAHLFQQASDLDSDGSVHSLRQIVHTLVQHMIHLQACCCDCEHL